MQLSNYLIIYLDESGEENVCEIPAYSKEQAVFLAPCAYNKIVDTECAIAHIQYNSY